MPGVGELNDPGFQVQDEVDERNDLRHEQLADKTVESAHALAGDGSSSA
jgi:hypothetical protein